MGPQLGPGAQGARLACAQVRRLGLQGCCSARGLRIIPRLHRLLSSPGAQVVTYSTHPPTSGTPT